MRLHRLLGVLLVPLILVHGEASSQEVRAFTATWTGARTLEPKKDYISVTLLDGWLDKDDGFFAKIFGSNKKLAVLIDTKVTFFDSATIDSAIATTNSNPPASLNTPWGINAEVIDRIPADVVTSTTIKVTMYKDDKIEQTLKAVTGAGPATSAIAASPYFAYATIVDNLFKSFFGLGNENYPFLWTGNFLSVGGTLKEQYVILVAAKKSNDSELTGWKNSLLKYDTDGRVTYDGKSLGRSFAVFKISKVEGYDIGQLLVGESTAPWAVLGVNSFLSVDTGQASTKDQLTTLATTLTAQLKNEIDLLKREHRFSSYSRAQALTLLAKWAIDPLETQCTQSNVSPCPVGGLKQIADKTALLFGLPAGDQPEVNRSADESRKKLEAGQQFKSLRANAAARAAANV